MSMAALMTWALRMISMQTMAQRRKGVLRRQAAACEQEIDHVVMESALAWFMLAAAGTYKRINGTEANAFH